jgi:predicted dienelactone hydrolase
MGWIAAALAEAGFIVAGPNHPGTTSGDSSPAETVKLWQRTADLSAVIDRLSIDPEWRDALDPARIGVVGFSIGGATAMEIAGARADLDAYARYCDFTIRGIVPGLSAASDMSMASPSRWKSSICGRSTKPASSNRTAIRESGRPCWWMLDWHRPIRSTA